MQRALLLDDEELERTIRNNLGRRPTLLFAPPRFRRRLLLDGESRDIFYFFRSRFSFCSVLSRSLSRALIERYAHIYFFLVSLPFFAEVSVDFFADDSFAAR
jgi:hypothetical protein